MRGVGKFHRVFHSLCMIITFLTEIASAAGVGVLFGGGLCVLFGVGLLSFVGFVLFCFVVLVRQSPTL